MIRNMPFVLKIPFNWKCSHKCTFKWPNEVSYDVNQKYSSKCQFLKFIKINFEMFLQISLCFGFSDQENENVRISLY